MYFDLNYHTISKRTLNLGPIHEFSEGFLFNFSDLYVLKGFSCKKEQFLIIKHDIMRIKIKTVGLVKKTKTQF
jgi:hypothetical protein